MKIDALLLKIDRFGLFDVDMRKVLERIVEVTATYVMHSTIFLVGALILLAVAGRWRSRSSGVSPSLAEITWKLAAILPLLTAPLCVGSSCSPRMLVWSLNSLSPVPGQIDRTGNTNLNSRRLVNTGSIALVPVVPIEPNQNAETEDFGQLLSRADLEMIAGLSKGNYEQTLPFSAKSELTAQTTVDAPSIRTVLWQDDTKRTQSTLAVPNQTVPFSGVQLAGIVIEAWIGLSCCRLLWIGISLHRWLQRCEPIETQLRQDLDSLVPNRGRIRLLRAMHPRQKRCDTAGRKDQQTKLTVLPFACGVWQWTIVLPTKIEERLSADELSALLTHEAAHLVRRDPAWQWFGHVLCTCLVFQPLNLVARWRWQQAAEMLCDDWAVERKIAPTQLARCLAQIAEWRLDPTSIANRTPQMGLPAVGNVGPLTQRIEWLLRKRSSVRPKQRLRQLSIVLVAAVAAMSLGASGPRLTLTSFVQASTPKDASRKTDSTHEELIDELNASERELRDLQSRLKSLSNPEIDSLVSGLRRRVEQIKADLAK